MSKKRSPLLIYNVEGDVENCHECPPCPHGGICTNQGLKAAFEKITAARARDEKKDCDEEWKKKNRACNRDKPKVAYVVHYNMSMTDKDDKKEFKGAVSKGVERFLCKDCYIRNWRDNPMRFSGQSDFTFVTVMEWKKLSYQYK